MAKWTIDPTHSEVHFKVKHLMISTVTGTFKTFEGTMEADDDAVTNASINFTADTDSIDTRNDQRDGHLKSPDFFDSANFPKMSFVSTAFEKQNDTQYVLKGNLTIKDSTQPVELSVDFGGIEKDSYGNTRAGFEMEGTLNRSEFGLVWSALTETGSVMVSDDVRLIMNVELIKQA